MRIAAITQANPKAFEAWFRICRGFAPERLNPNFVWYVAQTFLALDSRGDGRHGRPAGGARRQGTARGQERKLLDRPRP